MSNERRTALITGGRRGIGFGIAQALAREGFHLLINDIAAEREVEDALGNLRLYGHDVIYCRADISNAGERERLISTAESQLGRVNILVNNAGVAPETRADILQASEESFERVMRVNLQGPYFLTQSVANLMVSDKNKGGKAFFCIINIASSNSLAASVDRGEYCLSKSGVSMATKLWAVRLGEFDIPVYEIRPGIIRTDMTAAVTRKYDKLIEQGLLLQKRWGQPEDVGKVVAALARGALAYSTGQIIYVDGGQLVERL